MYLDEIEFKDIDSFPVVVNDSGKQAHILRGVLCWVSSGQPVPLVEMMDNDWETVEKECTCRNRAKDLAEMLAPKFVNLDVDKIEGILYNAILSELGCDNNCG